MVWKLSSLFSGEIRQSGSSLIDAFSVPAAASSLSSSIPWLAVPALFLATLGGGVFGAPLYEGSSGSGSSISNGSSNLDDTFPAPDAKPATLKSVAHIENDVYEVVVYSPSMDREVKNEVILPGGPDSDSPRPTFYLLMGADGAANGWSWRNSSDYQEFFQDKLVNVVTPIGSVSSMQADWYREDKATGRNKWLTYFTKELPPLIDEHFHGTGRDAIAGISMSGGPALNIASLKPERFAAAASYSGCPSTSGVLGDTYVRQALKLNGADPHKMWGMSSNPAWTAHSPVLHLDALEGTKLFVSAAQGVPGSIDDTKSSSERIGPPVAIESASYACSEYFVDRAQRAGLDVQWYPQVEGTHSWGLFEKSMRKSWSVIGPAIDALPFERGAPVTKTPLPDEAPQPVGGSAGSSK
ncbi:esterase family protein [Corynebacterium afermentans]|uniref:alpha/beta hydrolase n=1 Tax=Corynebacterium afermentans TaxID=38286 RepID=UPI002573AD14|nr:alpha/beta hydrolase family protein [Corynebacterium afermentans]MCG7291128.1 esterase family protein [Corynebacterium afermentans]